MCEHKNFKAEVNITRLTDLEDTKEITGFRADVKIICADCFIPFQFIGLSGGYSPSQPTINVDGTQLRLPIQPV